MKSTGVVRRVDELGRIVIPKEIRRTLRIKDGESLEILVDKDMIFLKKFSKLSNMEDMAKQLSDVLYQSVNKNIFVTDSDTFIAAAGNLKKKYIGGRLSPFLESLIKDIMLSKSNELIEIELLDKNMELCSYVSAPIVVNGDAVGLVLIVSKQADLTDLEENLVTITAQILGKYVEE